MTLKSRPIKILVLSHISELLGGAERSMLDILDGWAKKYDDEPEFILREPLKSLAPAIHKRGWKYYPVDFTFWSDGKPPETKEEIAHNAAKNLRAIEKIEKIIGDTKPDVVMTNSIVSPWAALAAYSQKVPHVWFVREYGDLDHGRVFEIGREKIWHDVGQLSQLVVANSATLAKHATTYIDKRKVTFVYTPFNIDEIIEKSKQEAKAPFKDSKSLKLVMTGSIAPSKGQVEVIEAVAKLNAKGDNTELSIIGRSGDADFTEELNKLLNKLSISGKVHFVGYQMNPLSYVAQADIGIMASRMEAFGRTTFEYLALSKPVVGTNTGATPEMVKPGINGYLYTPGDSEGLARQLEHYAKKPELIIKHGKASMKQAEQLMQSAFNSDALYKRVKEVVRDGFKPADGEINYSYRLEEYKRLAKEGAKGSDLGLKRRVRIRGRRYARAVYVRLRRYKTRIAGK